MENLIAIVPFRPEFADAFFELNRAWIEQYFALEDSDWKVLRDPQTAIIAPGGAVFFALDGDDVVGTAAAIRMSASNYDLVKMAVRPSHQGRGIGELLGRAVIEWARGVGAHKMTLETNRVLASAIRLYERLGFENRPRPNPSEYARADVYMELDL